MRLNARAAAKAKRQAEPGTTPSANGVSDWSTYFWNGGFAFHVQALAAVAAVLLAAHTVRVWNFQEASKQRSTIALEILQRLEPISYHYLVASNTAKLTLSEHDSEKLLARLYSSEVRTAIETAGKHVTELEKHSYSANAIFENGRLDDLLLQIMLQVNVMEDCLNEFQKLDEQVARDEAWNQRVKMLAKNMISEPGIKESLPCQYKFDKLSSAILQIKDLLKPEASFKGRLGTDKHDEVKYRKELMKRVGKED